MMKSYVYRSTIALTFSVLPLLCSIITQAAPNPKRLTKNRTGHAQATSPGTRFVATGTIDATTSSLKAISADNHFTWMRVQPATLIVQAGRRLTPGSIGEGDKLLCQGAWVDDAWGPIFQAKRVEIIGHINAAGLQEKVAAACQSATQGNPSRSGSSGFSRVDTGGVEDRQAQDLQDYLAAVNARCDAVDQAKHAMLDQVQKAVDFGHDSRLHSDFDQEQRNYGNALDRLGSISPVPPAMTKANDIIRKGVAAYREWSSLYGNDYVAISIGQDTDRRMLGRVRQFDEAQKLMQQAFAETKRVVDNFTR